jgi:hypothetical protein
MKFDNLAFILMIQRPIWYYRDAIKSIDAIAYDSLLCNIEMIFIKYVS